jgi:hypothetical protein
MVRRTRRKKEARRKTMRKRMSGGGPPKPKETAKWKKFGSLYGKLYDSKNPPKFVYMSDHGRIAINRVNKTYEEGMLCVYEKVAKYPTVYNMSHFPFFNEKNL